MAQRNDLFTILLSLLLVGLTGCTTVPSLSGMQYVTPLDGASVLDNRSRYSRQLECLRSLLEARTQPLNRFAVGRVNDFSGKEDLNNGKRITQGASLMVISALSRAGIPLVERFDTSISDMELKYADNRLISDDPGSGQHRQLMAGSIPGSDFHVIGGITEVNYNIKSGSAESSINFTALGARYFVMNIGLDLRLVHTKTLQVVNVQSLQKQILGTELRGGFFRIFTNDSLDISLAEKTQEPIQRAVRMVIEQAILNMLSELYNVDTNLCERTDGPTRTISRAPSSDEINFYGGLLNPSKKFSPIRKSTQERAIQLESPPEVPQLIQPVEKPSFWDKLKWSSEIQ